MSVEYRVGDLFEQDVQALGHGVNCAGRMGAGIAPLFKERFPGMFTQYALACRAGTLKPGGVFVWQGENQFVFNMASQDKPGANALLYWMRKSLHRSLVLCEELGIESLAIPRIGCGIGGLRWEDVRQVCDILSSYVPVHLVVVSLPGDES